MTCPHPSILTNNEKLKAGWAMEEFGQIDLGDRRRTRRLVQCLEAMAEQPGKSIPGAFDGWAETKAFYRLIDCEQLTDEAIFTAHRQACLRRAAASDDSVFLAVQDTTSANFTSHEKLEGQGPISNSEHASGLLLHSTLLIGGHSAETYGLLGSKIYTRRADKRSQQPAGKRNREPIEKKESYRWLESFELARSGQVDLQKLRQASQEPGSATGRPATVISVGDREADIYELLLEAKALREQGVGLLVRSQHNRELEEEEQRLWEQLAKSRCQGKLTVSVPEQKRRNRLREVPLEVRFREASIQAPAHKSKYLGLTESVNLWAVEVREPGGKKEGICWRLVSTFPVESVEQARQVCRWYSHRWQIEEFHRVLKTGCRVEGRRFQTMDRMRPMIAIDMVIACLILNLRQASRSRPEAPATQWLGRDEVNALVIYYKHKHKRKKKLIADLDPVHLGIGTAVRLIAQIGGHLGRKGDGPPGAEVLWRGLCELHTITSAYQAFAS